MFSRSKEERVVEAVECSILCRKESKETPERNNKSIPGPCPSRIIPNIKCSVPM